MDFEQFSREKGLSIQEAGRLIASLRADKRPASGAVWRWCKRGLQVKRAASAAGPPPSPQRTRRCVWSTCASADGSSRQSKLCGGFLKPLRTEVRLPMHRQRLHSPMSQQPWPQRRSRELGTTMKSDRKGKCEIASGNTFSPSRPLSQPATSEEALCCDHRK
jgi:hypothetical protein